MADLRIQLNTREKSSDKRGSDFDNSDCILIYVHSFICI